MCDWLLANALDLASDMRSDMRVAANTALCVDSQIAVLKYAHCQNLHIDTTPITITNKYICKCFVCGKNWYESQVVSGNPLALLGVKMVQ